MTTGNDEIHNFERDMRATGQVPTEKDIDEAVRLMAPLRNITSETVIKRLIIKLTMEMDVSVDEGFVFVSIRRMVRCESRKPADSDLLESL